MSDDRGKTRDGAGAQFKDRAPRNPTELTQIEMFSPDTTQQPLKVDQKSRPDVEMQGPTFLKKVKDFVHTWGGVVSIVKVHHGGTYSNQGIMYYTSFFNTILSLSVVFFLLIFSSNDFAQFGAKSSVQPNF
jgi:hypothetical protein